MFKVKSQTAFVVNVNPRKERAGDDPNGELAADIKFRLQGVPAGILKALAPMEPGTDKTIVDGLFDDKGAPRFRDGFGTINFAARCDDSNVTVSGKTFRGSRLKGFVVERMIGGKKVDMVFTAQVHPTPDQAGWLCDKMKTDVTITVEGGSLELDLDGDGEDEGDENQGGLELIPGGKKD